MKIVRANLNDAKEIVALHDKLSKQHPFVPTVVENMKLKHEWMNYWLRKERKYHDVLLAKDKGKIVGNFWIGHMDDSERAHNAGFGVAILKKHLNKGVGTALLKRAEKWAQKKECLQLRARVVTKNRQAIFFFLKRGFTFEGLKQKSYAFDGKYYDEYIFVKHL